MQTKILEIRDRATFISVLAVSMVSMDDVQRYFLSRAGYGDTRLLVMVVRMSAGAAEYDPYSWGGRTMPVAHKFIEENFYKLSDGDVIDVEFILGEKDAPSVSERLEYPL